MPRRSVALSLAASAILSAAAPAAATRYVEGSAGSGDPFFPLAGNGGYDARHYSLDLDYTRESNQLTGRTVMFARAKQNCAASTWTYATSSRSPR